MSEFRPFLPEIVLSGLALLILFAGAFRRPDVARLLPFAAVGSLVATLFLLESDPARGDAFGFYARFAVLCVGVLVTLALWAELDQENPGEVLSAVLFSFAGAMLIAGANDLIVLFLGLELVSLPIILPATLGRSGAQAQEAGNKYYFLSILSAAVLLYGFSFLYGVTGTVRLRSAEPAKVEAALAELQAADLSLAELTAAKASALTLREAEDRVRSVEATVAEADDLSARARLVVRGTQGRSRAGLSLLVLGAVLSVIGLCFKLAAVPFHFYAPDVYQGAPSAVSGMIAFLPKASGLFALLKLGAVALAALTAGEAVGQVWFHLFWGIAVASMTLGNVLGLLQKNVKRMLAYSSIAHTGYLLVGAAAVIAAPAGMSEDHVTRNGAAAALFYVLVYGVMTAGAFAALSMIRTSGGEPAETLDDLGGLARRKPAAAFCIAVLMFSLTGLPPTAGFLGKLSLFSSALAAPAGAAGAFAPPHYWLVVLAVLNSAVGAYYYLGVVGTMYLREPVGNIEVSTSYPLRFAVGICTALMLAWGIRPDGLMRSAVHAAQRLHGLPAEVVRVADESGATPDSDSARRAAAEPRPTIPRADSSNPTESAGPPRPQRNSPMSRSHTEPLRSVGLAVSPCRRVAASALMSVLLCAAAASAEAPKVRAGVEALPGGGALYFAGEPVRVRFSLSNAADAAVELKLRNGAPSPAGAPVLLSDHHLLSSDDAGPWLRVHLAEGARVDPAAALAPETATHLVLGPRTTLSRDVDLTAHYPRLKAPGFYEIAWRPFPGSVAGSSLLKIHVVPRKEVVLKTDAGDITLELLYDVAPRTCLHFVKLVESSFYDGLVFHRVARGVLIQGGGMDATGNARTAAEIEAEFNKTPQKPGIVAMARRADPDETDSRPPRPPYADSARSQFFIGLTRMADWDGRYTAFARVRQGMEAANKIGDAALNDAGRPKEPVVIRKAVVRNVEPAGK